MAGIFLILANRREKHKRISECADLIYQNELDCCEEHVATTGGDLKGHFEV
jgi:hypothetical protein